MVADMHAGGNPAKGRDEAHLRQLFASDFKAALAASRLARCTSISARKSPAPGQSLEAVELTLGESGRRLPLIDPLLGLAGIQARQRLPPGDACPLTNI